MLIFIRSFLNVLKFHIASTFRCNIKISLNNKILTEYKIYILMLKPILNDSIYLSIYSIMIQ